MPKNRYWTVEVPTTTQGNGSSDTAIHQAAFPNSPIYKGELTKEVVTALVSDLIQGDTINDGGHTFGEISRNYTEAPNMADVAVGGGGLPGSPFGPNIASPTEGLDPTTIPAAIEATEKARGQGSPFPGDGLASPSTTSVVVSSQTTLGSLSFGRSKPNA